MLHAVSKFISSKVARDIMSYKVNKVIPLCIHNCILRIAYSRAFQKSKYVHILLFLAISWKSWISSWRPHSVAFWGHSYYIVWTWWNQNTIMLPVAQSALQYASTCGMAVWHYHNVGSYSKHHNLIIPRGLRIFLIYHAGHTEGKWYPTCGQSKFFFSYIM